MELEFTWELILFIFLVQFAANVVKGITGFGSGVISGTVFALRMNNSIITPVNVLIDFPVNLFLVLRERKHFSPKKIWLPTLVVVLTVIPGALLLKYSPPWILKVVLGGVVIFLGVQMIVRKKESKDKKISLPLQYLAYVASGLTSGLFGMGQMFLPVFERAAKDRHEFRGSICFVYVLDNVVRITTYIVTGLITLTVLKIVAISIVAVALGVLLGVRLDRYIPEKTSRALVITVFILGGLVTMLKALITQS